MIKGLMGSVGVRFLAIPISFAINVVLARSLDIIEFGIYSYIIATVSLFMMPAFTGWSTYLIKITRRTTSLLAERRNLVLGTLVICGISSILCSLFLMFTTDYSAPLYVFVFLLSFLFPLTINLSSVLRSNGYKSIGQVPDSLVKPFVFLILITLLGFFSNINVGTVVFFQLVSIIIALLFCCILIRLKIYGWAQALTVSKNRFLEITRSGFPFLSIAIVTSINNNLPMIYIGNLSNIESVALYKIASQASSVVNVFLAGVLAWTAPFISEAELKGRFIIKRLITITLVSLLVTIFVSVALYVFSAEIITMFYTIKYIVAVSALKLLVINEIVLCGFLIMHQFLVMRFTLKYSIAGVIASIITNLALAPILIPEYGAEGAAMAVLASSVVWFLVSYFMIYKVIND